MTMTFATLTRMADNLLLYKYIIKNVARQNGKTVTFMPKPLFGDNGSGMHVHSSLWKGNTNVFYDEKGYAGLSQTAKYYIGGVLKHAPALLALTSPTTNSFRRLFQVMKRQSILHIHSAIALRYAASRDQQPQGQAR